jgi:ubiquinone/menaquinone biosynthesis C-methylase UbiE
MIEMVKATSSVEGSENTRTKNKLSRMTARETKTVVDIMEKSQVYKKNSETAFDKQANSYDSSFYGHHGRKMHEFTIKAMDKFEYKSVLDVGCGTGNFLFELFKRKKVALAGIDISEKMLNVAKKRLGKEADLRNGDSERLPWKNNSFDIVTCTDSFHHYPNPKAVLNEMRRVLNPGGKVIIADPWAPPPFRQIANLFLIPLSKNGDVRLYSKSEMKKLLEECGFTLISWEKIDVFAFLLVATAT